jgi:hypothetical protein
MTWSGRSGRPPSAGAPTAKALVSELTRAGRGVSDGARTRDTQDHNLVLYRLSYTHHDVFLGSVRREDDGKGTGGAQASDAAVGAPSVARAFASPAASNSAKASTTEAAAPWASSPDGPGAGTNRVRR